MKCLLGILQSMIISRTVNILKIATKLSTKVSVASAVRRIQKNAETVLFSAICGVRPFCSVIRLGLAKIMLCIDNQVVDIALPVVYTLRTRQCFNVLRHFSSDSANLIIFRDVHAILNVKVSAIGISILAVRLLSNLNYLVSLEISMLV